jgi:ribosomal protein S18 acetylase RimI-like enzyme
MPIRAIALPRDLTILSGMVIETFQYPENPEWSVQDDQQEKLVEGIAGLRRMWPLIRAIQTVSPSLRDILRGRVWEEGGSPVGVVMFQRNGKTNDWYINTVGVLPGYRRRGIARKLIVASLDDMRAKAGRAATLNVIQGNLPAQELYESLGFETYGGATAYHLLPNDRVEIASASLPDGFRESPLSEFDWRARYELEKRIAPETTRRYEPIEPAKFRHPPMMRALLPIIEFAQKSREKDFVIRASDGRTVVGRAGYTLSTSGKGTHGIRVRLDPASPELAPYMIGRLLREVNATDPALRVELGVPSWMPAVAAAAESHGFKRRLTGLQMGLDLASS